MPVKTFISFRGEDEFKVWTLRGLAGFRNIPFEMDDVSLRNSIDSTDEQYIKRVIRPKIQSCKACLCLVGENTHRSRKWVPWELDMAQEVGARVIAMTFKDTGRAITPAALTRIGVVPHVWDLDWLYDQLSR
ncbi:TIR domain-containing protein [Variovorax sp. dw_308]|uniref:TIR domain-containing protein n=1 Tax=Variovorax sp. dw_308 TaxID=2721546 RepID=UPI001C495251|nr:TIR domain-containing protein [Variovorax sp. dw_308]